MVRDSRDRDEKPAVGGRRFSDCIEIGKGTNNSLCSSILENRLQLLSFLRFCNSCELCLSGSLVSFSP